MAKMVVERAHEEEPAGLTAVVVNNRFLYYVLAYYGRDYFGDPTAPPLKAWLLTGRPENQAEADAPLTTATRGRVLAALNEGRWRREMTGDFETTSGLQIANVRLDRKHSRQMDMFVAEGFRPAPRDPVTGLPIAGPPLPGLPRRP
jgi:hypothetical protein